MEIAETRNLNRRPESFETVNSEEETRIRILERISTENAIPAEMLAEFEIDPPLHSTNSEAEEVLLKLTTALIKRKALDVIAPMVTDGMAEELLNVTYQTPVPEANIDEQTKYLAARDAVIGERFYYADGSALVIQKDTIDSDNTVLVLLEGRKEIDFFWVRRQQDGQWKVDVTNLINEHNAPGMKLFGGIRLGMSAARVEELIADYRRAENLRNFASQGWLDGNLVFTWNDRKHIFRFKNDELITYIQDPLNSNFPLVPVK